MDQAEIRPKVLVIDDDDVARLLTVRSLEELGFSITEADCGERGVSAFRGEPPDLVLLDALMPGLDGFETCSRLRALPGGEHVPVLMLTGLDDEGSICRAYEAGATDFFVKSDHWTLLVQRIRYLLRASSTHSELIKSRAKEARAQRIARLGHWEWDVARQTCIASEECFRLMGRPASQLAMPETQFFGHLHKDDRAWVESIIAGTLRDGSLAQLECRMVAEDESIHTVHLEFEAERDVNGIVARVQGVIQDITERKRTEDQIRVLANFDGLTGLSNRNLFAEQFGCAINRAQRDSTCVVLLTIDLDRFKQINDTLGHGAGDQLLMETGLRLNQAIRDGAIRSSHADLVGRLGGDEFAVMLTGLADLNDAEAAAEHLMAAVRKPIRLAGQDVISSAAVGISGFPRDGDNPEQLLQCADIAMNAAKASGKNAMQVYKSGLNAVSRGRLALEQALHKALERKELIMYYQPQIDTQLCKIVGAEALMRWQHDGRLVQPGEFISIAEDTGLIIPFGEWAINHVVGQNRVWVDMGFEPLLVAVNIPGSHFERGNFVALVKEILARQCVKPEFLELEITETSLMGNLTSTLPVLDQLTEFGIKLSVDDFGTGYSSLSYLKRLPIDTLKIDGSFVRELHNGSDNEAIVAAIIAMAKSLNLRVIAEGVETYEQVTLLNAYGCHTMQGYYFSRPIPAADFARFRLEYGDQNPLPKVKPWVAGSSSASSARQLVRPGARIV